MTKTKTIHAKRPVGRPVDVGGKRVHVYLDQDSLEIALKIGNGNVSDGIRQALAKIKSSSEPRATGKS